jgi:hypothetical protein
MRGRLVVPVALSAVCAGLAGCGATGGDGTRPEAVRPLSAGGHGQVRVGLTEWTIEVSRSEVNPGRLRLLVTNAGATVHDLVVQGRRGTWETPDLRPGQQARLDVRAVPHETLQLWCSMPGHRAQGMHTTLTAS